MSPAGQVPLPPPVPAGLCLPSCLAHRSGPCCCGSFGQLRTRGSETGSPGPACLQNHGCFKTIRPAPILQSNQPILYGGWVRVWLGFWLRFAAAWAACKQLDQSNIPNGQTSGWLMAVKKPGRMQTACAMDVPTCRHGVFCWFTRPDGVTGREKLKVQTSKNRSQIYSNAP